jgi:hypothetical protein
MKRSFLLMAPLPFILSACIVGTQNLTRDMQAADPLANESILVIGFPQPHRVHIASGTRSPGGWASDETPMSSAVVVNTLPGEGYIVARVPHTAGNKVYGLTAVMPGGGFAHFKACAGNMTPVFEAPAGKVVYVGRLNVASVGGKLQVQPDVPESVDDVKRNLGQRFPTLAAAIVAQPLRMERLTKALCTSPSR